MKTFFAFVLSVALAFHSANAIETRQIPGVTGQLFVTGGIVPEEFQGDVEVLDLSDDGPVTPCFKPANLPQPLFRHTGTFLKGAPYVCGGSIAASGPDGQADQKYCFVYVYLLNGAVDRWDVDADRMDFARVGPGSTLMSDGEFWLTGGQIDDAESSSSEKIVEFLSEGDADSKVDLPVANSDHNVIRIDDNNAFFTNGFTATSYMYSRSDPGDEGSFTAVADQSVARFQGHAGMITKADGTRSIVSAGGVGVQPASTEIFDLDGGDGQWRAGPDLPFTELGGGASVQLENTFLIVGGLTDVEGSGNILWFDPDAEVWNFAPQVLTTPRWDFAAMMAPEGYVQC